MTRFRQSAAARLAPLTLQWGMWGAQGTAGQASPWTSRNLVRSGIGRGLGTGIGGWAEFLRALALPGLGTGSSQCLPPSQSPASCLSSQLTPDPKEHRRVKTSCWPGHPLTQSGDVHLRAEATGPQCLHNPVQGSGRLGHLEGTARDTVSTYHPHIWHTPQCPPRPHSPSQEPHPCHSAPAHFESETPPPPHAATKPARMLPRAHPASLGGCRVTHLMMQPAQEIQQWDCHWTGQVRGWSQHEATVRQFSTTGRGHGPPKPEVSRVPAPPRRSLPRGDAAPTGDSRMYLTHVAQSWVPCQGSQQGLDWRRGWPGQTSGCSRQDWWMVDVPGAQGPALPQRAAGSSSTGWLSHPQGSALTTEAAVASGAVVGKHSPAQLVDVDGVGGQTLTGHL